LLFALSIAFGSEQVPTGGLVSIVMFTVRIAGSAYAAGPSVLIASAARIERTKSNSAHRNMAAPLAL